MAEQSLSNGHVFKFKRENSTLILTEASDHSHENTIFRKSVTISGSGANLNTYGTVQIFNHDHIPALKINSGGTDGDGVIGFYGGGSWVVGQEEGVDEFRICNSQVITGVKSFAIDSSNNVQIPNGKIKWTGKATSGVSEEVNQIYMDGDGRADLCYWERDANNKCWIGYDGNDNNPPHFTIKLYNGSSNKYFKFHDSGVFETTGLNNTSDARLKTNIRSLKTPLEKVCSLKGIKFDWKDSTSGLDQIGLLAQEVEKVIPEIVITAPGKAENGETLSQVDNQKSISYVGLVPYLIESIKELTTKVEALEKRLGDK